jgi:aryl-alcohol dehydrogenase-like predicted oxidoreductase
MRSRITGLLVTQPAYMQVQRLSFKVRHNGLMMRYVKLNELPPVSKIGLGTLGFGDRSQDPAIAQAIVQRALELGVTHFDTAEGYGFGRSERLLGSALGDRRDEVVVTTKFFPLMPLPSMTRRHARASRQRLGVSRIALYLLHMPNPLLPHRAIMRGLREAQDEGVVGAVGVSNYGLGGWRSAEAALGRPVVANQVHFSLVHPQPARDLVPWAREHGRLLVTASPLAMGLLSGRYGDDDRLPEQLRQTGPLLTLLSDVATSHGATPVQVALAWLIHFEPVVAIPGASSVAQLESNAAAAEIHLTDAEHSALTEMAERVRPLNPVRIALARRRVRGGSRAAPTTAGRRP